ncbi:MAG TPA: DEAD/DEAH box helicase [Gemmatimonadaceae bacterium]|nr:DEAD/DEAH box helicase [Gemmatimonadaceae bacterium]
MGKTYVATAVARRYDRVLIIAPAGLSSMWNQALLQTRLEAQFVSFEKLSRTKSGDFPPYDLIIVDEAHHARNRRTHRYAQLLHLARTAKVLLLTATPIHNRRDEMVALLSLFMGQRANSLSRDELSRCAIRREHRQLERSALIPEVAPVVALQVGDRPDVVEALMNLPPAIALRDGGLAQALVGRGLVHQWASSEAALRDALRKRIARATALIASLSVGTYPTERDLRTWTFSEGVLQLGFAEFLAPPESHTESLLLCVTRHRDALQHLLASLDRKAPLDAERTSFVHDIRRSHRNEKVVAFAQYAATVTMLFRSLLNTGRIAMLTARGASVASGKLTKDETLSQFAPSTPGSKPAARAGQIDLLLTTDLLSEGVNLQNASVIVHLDLPWTAARMEQRVGRAARIGSPTTTVQPYLISPPASAAAVLQNDAIIRRKWEVAKRAIGSTTVSPIPCPCSSSPNDDSETPTHLIELLRSMLDTWRLPTPTCSDPTLGCVASAHVGFLAAVNLGGQMQLVVDLDGQISTSAEAQITCCRAACGPDVEVDAQDYTRAIARLNFWVESKTASSLAGTASSTLRRRRLLNRIDRAIEDAPPHLRATRLQLATRARRVVIAQHSGAIEAELESLTRSDLQSDDWLAAIARFEAAPHPDISKSNASEQASALDRSFTVHALLLLRRQSPA